MSAAIAAGAGGDQASIWSCTTGRLLRWPPRAARFAVWRVAATWCARMCAAWVPLLAYQMSICSGCLARPGM